MLIDRIESQVIRIESLAIRIESQNIRIKSQNIRIESQNIWIESQNIWIKSQNIRIESQVIRDPGRGDLSWESGGRGAVSRWGRARYFPLKSRGREGESRISQPAAAGDQNGSRWRAKRACGTRCLF
jgi:hypothetical protein